MKQLSNSDYRLSIQAMLVLSKYQNQLPELKEKNIARKAGLTAKKLTKKL